MKDIKTSPLNLDNVKTEHSDNGTLYACMDFSGFRYEVGELDPECLNFCRVRGHFVELIESKEHKDMNVLEHQLYSVLREAMEKAKAEETAPYYAEPKTECFYTGGGYWCTIHQLSGKMSDYYYGLGSEDENGTMCLFSHKADRECNNDEYAFYGVIRYIDIDSATEAEKAIYYTMAEEEEKTLKEHGCFSEAYKR